MKARIFLYLILITSPFSSIRINTIKVLPAENLSKEDRSRIEGIVLKQYNRLRQLSGRVGTYPKVQVLPSVWQYCQVSGSSSNEGGCYTEGIIFLQPLAKLNDLGGLEKILKRESTLAFFAPYLPDAPLPLLKGLAQYYSDGTVKRDSSYTRFDGKLPESKDKLLKLYRHWGWILFKEIRTYGEMKYLDILLMGKADWKKYQ